jgi:serine protease Do
MVQAITPSMAAGLGLASDRGVVVGDVVPGGTAEAAGLKIQDIITGINDKPVDSVPEFNLRSFMLHAGKSAKVTILRGREPMTLDIPVAERQQNTERLLDIVTPEMNLIARLGILGIQVEKSNLPLLPDLREPSGVIVAGKTQESSAISNLLAVGDVIHGLNGSPIISLEYLRTALEGFKFNDPVVLQIEREGHLMFLAFRMD